MNDFVKIVVAPVGATLGVLGLALYATGVFSDANQADFKQKVKHMDEVPTAILRSARDCKSKGFSKNACDCAFKQSDEEGSKLGLSPSYDSEAECKQKHFSYTKETTQIPITNMIGQTMVTTYVPSTHFDPDVVAIQVEKNNICSAVPLYSGKNSNEAVRYDGKKFALDSL